MPGMITNLAAIRPLLPPRSQSLSLLRRHRSALLTTNYNTMTDAMLSAAAHFLDRPAERATRATLSAVGVSVAPGVVNPGRAVTLDLVAADAHEVLQEHYLLHKDLKAVYSLAEGSPRVFLDVRDSADAWIRLTLSPETQVEVAGHVWRRFVLDSLAGSSGPVILAHLESCEGRPFVPRFARQQDASALREAPAAASAQFRELVCTLCRQYYDTEWMTGTGGAMSLRFGERVFVTPSGVPKERLSPDDLYVLDLEGAVIASPVAKPGSDKVPKLSDCAPLFMHVHKQRGAGAVIHSHGVTCNLVTAMCAGRDSFRISHQEMIKGLTGHGYADELEIPIIDNEPTEAQLAAPIRDVLQNAPDKVSAVLVRRHGLFVWGNTWEAAKRHAECLHYLFQAALEMHRLGIDYSAPASGAANPRKRQRQDDGVASVPSASSASIAERHKYVLFDIEGTTTPITFVHDVLFPYVTNNAERYLRETWATPTTQADVEALRAQHESDVSAGANPTPATLPTLSSVFSAEAGVALVEFIKWNVAADRKVGALKQLQGHMWSQGYESGELKAQVYGDVPVFFRRMREHGVRVAIYSSGSRQAQKLLFQYSDKGDLREFLCVYFDTKVGHKREVGSYEQILQSLGVDSGRDVLFVTDVIEEAQAAAEAGVDAVLSVRPGNKPLPESHPFQTITSFDQL